MPKVLDNISLTLVFALREMLEVSHRADFCVGYLHLRGWRKVADLVERFEGGAGKQARVLVGMNRSPEQDLEADLSLVPERPVDHGVARRRETELVEAFRRQLVFGLPDGPTEAGLRHLARQLRAGKVCVKLFLRHPLHAKLYLTYSGHPGAPTVGFVGSSNLTGPGLSEQGELNVDVTEQDAAEKLQLWFEARWNDPLSRDISERLAEIIEQSWVREELVSPYLVYLKIAYHLAFEALEAPREYRLPERFEEIVLPFQREAILRVRRMLRADPQHPNRNQIAILGDVVGMGKTLTAAAVAKLFQDEEGGRVVVCCPPKLESMWDSYIQEYEITGEVIPYSRSGALADQKGRCRLLVLDESHNLRNRQTIAWTNVRDFVRDQDARVLLLSATPYNKHYADLGNQLRLGLDEHADLGIRPEAYFRTHTEELFAARFQASTQSLIAFEQSSSPDDWRDLLRQFMVRRTRGWIIKHYAEYDPERDRYFLTLAGGVRSYFPRRVPRTLKYAVDPADPTDQYARLFNPQVVDTIGELCLPRYGLGAYVDSAAARKAPADDRELLENLSLAGERLLGYCRTNLFKRLESSGHAFLLSLQRHVLRNLVYLHALENGLDLPIGTQDAYVLDTATSDADPDSDAAGADPDEETPEPEAGEAGDGGVGILRAELKARAAAVYQAYAARRKAGKRKFRWLESSYFRGPELMADLEKDCDRLLSIVHAAGEWRADQDAKLTALRDLLTTAEASSRVLVFSQFADTAKYLAQQLSAGGIPAVESVTAASPRPVEQVRRFSPLSNQYTLQPGDSPLRVLVATEVLSEGQNCQDASVVVNYDLPWAIIRLIQRAGRVDRIGQDNAEVRIYSCLPADGVENLIALRSRLVGRLKQNNEVIGTDERFFDEETAAELSDIFTEKDHIYDETEDSEDVDLSTMAAGIWQEAMAADPSLEAKVKDLPPMVYATREEPAPGGVLVYFKTADGFDSLLKVDRNGRLVSQSQLAVLREAACAPGTPAQPRHARHHDLVRQGIVAVLEGQEKGDSLTALGPPRSARRRVYERMAGYRSDLRAGHRAQGAPGAGLFAVTDLKALETIIDGLVRHPLTERAREILNRQFREGIGDAKLAELVIGLAEDGRLFLDHTPNEGGAQAQPHLICSIGLWGVS